MTSVRHEPPMDPNKTYPIVTRWGIREMTGEAANNLARRQLTDRELINELLNRVAQLEKHLGISWDE